MCKFFGGIVVTLAVILVLIGARAGYEYNQKRAAEQRLTRQALHEKWAGKRVKFKLWGGGYVREVLNNEGLLNVRYANTDGVWCDEKYHYWELDLVDH